MENEIELLKEKFKEISKMGYIKTSRNGTTGIGKTFEDLLGKEEDSLALPDYHGIEIKTKRGYSKSYITLFNATVMGDSDFQTKRLKEKYGYPYKLDKELKVLYCSFFSKPDSLIANRYYFILKVDYNMKKIYLEIYDKYHNLIENEAYWCFDVLKLKLETKLTYLAIIKAWPSRINGENYYRYYNMKIYKLRSFEIFMRLIEEGIIRVSLKIGVVQFGEKRGEVSDHGTSFQIKEEDLEKLFERIY